jgi:hypothetical protein
MLGMGRPASGADVNPDLINAGKIAVTETPGASYVHHADSTTRPSTSTRKRGFACARRSASG